MPRAAGLSRRTGHARLMATQRQQSTVQPSADTVTPSSTLQQDKKLLESFYKELDKLRYVSCSNCSRLDLMKATEIYTCAACKKNPRKFSVSNNMAPPPLPDALIGLTTIEQMLIAKVNPVMSVYQTKAFGTPGQYHYKGNVINLPQDLSEIVTELPRTPSTVSVLIMQREGVSGMTDFRVRRQKVQDALVYLKANHKYYSDIEINLETISELPADGNVADELQFIETGGISSDVIESDDINITNVPIVAQQRQVDSIEKTINWPNQSSEPINEYTTEGYVTMAFPHLFPDGGCGFIDPTRNEKVTLREWAAYLLRHDSKRFAKDPRFRFFCLNTAQRHDAVNRNMIFAKKNDFTGNMQQLRTELSRDRRILNKLLAYGSTIRGTSTFWYQRTNELKAMVNQLGVPTMFLTLSAADLWWPCMARHFGISDEALADMTENQIARMMQEHLNDNPMIADEYFAKRVDEFMKIVKAKFEVIDYWFRYEYQHRGSPHVHCILWIKDAPDVRTFDGCFDEDLLIHKAFYDNLISAMNPGIDEPPAASHPSRLKSSDIKLDDEKQLAQLLNRVQRHTKHSKYCLRTVRGKEVCRFDFPKPMQSESQLFKDEKGKWQYIPKRNDTLMDEHNLFISPVWRANSDSKIIVDPNAMVNYLAKYASKGEPNSQAFCDIFNEIVNTTNEDEPAKKAFTSMLMKVVGQRDISACEVMHNLLGEPYYHSSRPFVKIYISIDEYQMITEDNEGEFVAKSLMDHYSTRSVELEEMTLHSFAISYNVTRGRLIKCRKEKVLQVIPRVTVGSDNDEVYYKQKLVLHKKWRGHWDTLKTLETWKDSYKASSLSVWELPDVDPDNVEEDVINIPETEERDWMALAAAIPNQPVNDTMLGHRDADLNFDWYSLIDKYPNLEDNLQFIKTSKETSESSTTRHQIQNIVLNQEQLAVIGHLEKQLSDEDSARLTIVQGSAGTGKSSVIREMVQKVETTYGSDSVLLMAPTGVAANNIGGKTIHSALRLTLTRNGVVSDLSGECERKFQQEMQNVKLIVCDEISMVGLKLMSVIDKRLRQAFPEKCEIAFGGVIFYLFGDFNQLPPVGDTSLLGTARANSPPALHGKLLFNQFTKVFILKKIMRQQGDSQLRFRELLQNLANGTARQEDYEMLKTRFSSNVADFDGLFKDAIRLHAKKDGINSYNQAMLRKLDQPVALIRASHNNSTASRASPDDAQGLEQIHWLASGSRVMLSQNLWTSQGLCNGTIGTVVDVIYKKADIERHLDDFLICVLVKFENYEGPSLYEGILPILPQVVSFKKSNVKCTRKQFPIRLAYAITVHKSQGVTLDKSVVDIGDKEFSLGLTYVALSRVKTIDGLAIQPSFPVSRLLDINKHSGWANKKEAMERLFALWNEQSIV